MSGCACGCGWVGVGVSVCGCEWVCVGGGGEWVWGYFSSMTNMWHVYLCYVLLVHCTYDGPLKCFLHAL